MVKEERIIKSGDIVDMHGYKMRFVGITPDGRYVLDFDGTKIVSDEFPLRKKVVEEIKQNREVLARAIALSIQEEIEKLLG